MNPSVFFILYLLFLFSCSGGNTDLAGNKNDSDSLSAPTPYYRNSFEKGKVIPKIKCANDSSLSYAFYLPKSYSADKKSPIIYLFDPHGKGSLPLEKYKGLAEKYRYILVGSNNSKNGMSWKENQPQIKIFMDDVKERLNIDPKRIYTCGFSGGSRVASSVAIFDGGINCVIGMGAGLPALTEPIRNRFDYIGFAGNEDFNMNEMIALTSSMDKSPIRHQLIVFNGKHEWVPAEIAEDAVVWLELNAMKDGSVSKSDSLFKKFIIKNDSAIKTSIQNKNVYEEWLLCKKRVNYLDGLMDVSTYKQKVEVLSNSDELKKYKAQIDKLSKEEFSSHESYRNNFLLKDISWWRAEINKLKTLSRDNANEEKSLMNKRLIGYLSLVAYMNVNSALDLKQFDLMEDFLKIYRIVDPENFEHQYLFSGLYAIKKDNLKAVSSLQNAVKLGFNDITRMESDSMLIGLHEDPGYKQLVQKLRSEE